MIAQIFVFISAFIFFVLGIIHLIYIFYSDKLLPRNSDIIEQMKHMGIRISHETNLWEAWIGFNSSHSAALILFGLVYGYFAIVMPDILFRDYYLLSVGVLFTLSFVYLAKTYWFSKPFAGALLASIFFIAGIIIEKLL